MICRLKAAEYKRSRFIARYRKMSRRNALSVLGGLSALVLPGPAGVRGPGHYDGVVFFDRWDSCYLFSGVYLMYVSRNVKEIFRPYAGRAMEIDAKDVWQPMNPGDGLIRKLTVVGEAKALAQTRLASVAGIGLQASVLVQGKRALANIESKTPMRGPLQLVSET